MSGANVAELPTPTSSALRQRELPEARRLAGEHVADAERDRPDHDGQRDPEPVGEPPHAAMPPKPKQIIVSV